MNGSARETYAKLHANTFGPSRAGETSSEAQAALDEIDRLRSQVAFLDVLVSNVAMRCVREPDVAAELVAEERSSLLDDHC